MIQYFDNQDKRHWNWRAVQIWQILISKAANKQLITYGELAEIMGFQGSTVLAHPLGHIMVYCEANELPPLTSLVINQGGSPGDGLSTLKNYESNDAARMEVFKTEWYKIIPPSANDYKDICNEF